MYTIARGDDEYTNLVRTAASAPTTYHLYQNEDLPFSYGSTDSNLTSKTDQKKVSPGGDTSIEDDHFINL